MDGVRISQAVDALFAVRGVTDVAVIRSPRDPEALVGAVSLDGAEAIAGARRAGAGLDALYALPVLPSRGDGTVDDEALARWLASDAFTHVPDLLARPTGGIPPLDEACLLFAEVLGQQVDPDAYLFDLGADSLLMVELADRASRAWGCRVDAIDILEQSTVRALVAALTETARS